MVLITVPGKFLGTVKRFTPEGSHRFLASAFDLGTNLIEDTLHRREFLTPPLRIRLHIGPFVDPRLYRETALRNLEGLKALGSLSPHDHVLDLGCGCGRIAAVLTRYLIPPGSYEGLDTAEEPVRWCQREIRSQLSHFRFQASNTQSRKYNPQGRIPPSKFVFPYPKESFTFVFALSVFTHMLPQDVKHYISEAARILQHDGKFLATFYLWNHESVSQITSKASTPRFPYARGEYRIADPCQPETFVAQSEASILGFYRNSGLKIEEPIHYASWFPRKNPSSLLNRFQFFQDVVVAVKT